MSLKKEKTKGKKNVRERYQNYTEEEKEKKPHYYCERSKTLSEEQKQKLVEYRRNYCLTHYK